VAKRILIADDVADMRWLLRRVIEGSGDFEVVAEAGDGRDAIEQARAHRPDVIVLDLAMPRMDGLEALPFLHSAAPGVRVLVLTSIEHPKIVERAISSCATRYLTKGTSSEEIIRVLDEVAKSPPKKGCAAQEDT
jgi:two-component system, chemotaxis family, chemotaxis protein CheY